MYEDDRAPVTFSEIYRQADSCQETVRRARERSRAFERFLPLEKYTDIIITGCGSSYNLASCASFAWSELLERPVLAAASSELAHFPDYYLARSAKPLVIAISRSGGTTEVKLAVERLQRDYGARSLAITTSSTHASAMTGGAGVAGVCDAHISFAECEERSVVMTQAFTSMLAGLYLLADGATGERRASEIKQLPALISDALRSTEQVIRPLAENKEISRFFFLGSGAMKGLADECALKMTEMALDSAFSYRTLEFRHGPKATLNPADLVVIFPVEAERQYLDTLLGEINATGARVLVAGEDVPEYASLLIPQSGIHNPQSEIFRPALYAHVGQLLAYWRAAARDMNPDAPRYLARTVLLNV